MSDEEDRQQLVRKLKAHVTSVTGLPGDDVDAWRKTFATYDRNADGLVDALELDRLLKNASVGNPFTRGTWVERVMNALNADRNVGISLTELMAAVAAGKAPPEPDVSLPIQSRASMRESDVEREVKALVGPMPFWGPLIAGAIVALVLKVMIGSGGRDLTGW